VNPGVIEESMKGGGPPPYSNYSGAGRGAGGAGGRRGRWDNDGEERAAKRPRWGAGSSFSCC
jgi:hypothetical protein